MDLTKPLVRRSNKNSGPHKNFEIKNIYKGESSENSSLHQKFEKETKNFGPQQSFEKKNHENR